MAHVTIGFVPRDRFCKAAEALERIFAHTLMPFDLVVVDCNTPERFKREIAAVLEGHDNVTVLHSDQYLLTNQAHNVIIAQNRSEFLCLIENDILVEEGWLEYLLAACEEHPADVAVPLIMERQEQFEKIHFDDRLGFIEEVMTPTGLKREIVSRAVSKEHDQAATRRSVGMIESHIVLYRSSVFARTGPFDETMSTRAEVDLSLTLHHAGASMVFEPKARVIYSPPPPIYPEERDYYLFKWDVERAVQNHEHLEQKWNLAHLPNSVDFVKQRRAMATDTDPTVQQQRELAYRAMLASAAAEIETLVPASDTMILVDDVQWKANEVAKDRVVLPFLERDGQYWGAPPDDSTAISELERLRRSGAHFVVFAEPAFWWLDHYRAMHEYLRTTFPCMLANERMVVFDLRA